MTIVATQITPSEAQGACSEAVLGGSLAAIDPRMDSARIRLEGRLEEVEAAVAAVKSVRASLRDGAPGALARLPVVLASLEQQLPQVRRHRGSTEVQAALGALRVETTGLVADGTRLAKLLGLTAPRSVQEVSQRLTPHLPLRMNARVIAKPFELAIFVAVPLMWLVAFSARLPSGATPVVPLVLAFWGGQLLFLVARSVRVVLSSRVLRLGPCEFAVSEIRAVHVELPGWMSRRGERAKVIVETRFGPQAPIKMPNALGPFMNALRESGVRVVKTGGRW